MNVVDAQRVGILQGYKYIEENNDTKLVRYLFLARAQKKLDRDFFWLRAQEKLDHARAQKKLDRENLARAQKKLDCDFLFLLLS